jgi:hypothetical protein
MLIPIHLHVSILGLDTILQEFYRYVNSTESLTQSHWKKYEIIRNILFKISLSSDVDFDSGVIE